MTPRPLTIAALGLALLAPSWAAAQVQCAMTATASHPDARGGTILASSSGEPALYFRGDLDVNTDGAARSYHPDDPRGQTLALNNIANGIRKIFDAEGRDITCSPRRGACYTRFIETFEAARDSGYAPNAPRIDTKHIIPWKMDPALGRETPCRIEDGPFKGYFVSQTALTVDPDAGVCDQWRYLDSMTFNAIVLPGGAVWRSQGVRTDAGDVTVVRDRMSGRIAFAVTGDTGPAAKVGEGTVALAAALSGAALTGAETFVDIKALARPDVEYLIFPRRDVPRATGGRFTQADIDRMGAEMLAAFGGPERMEACAPAIGG